MNDNAKNAIAFEGKTLEEAYSKAAKAYDCSIINLISEVIQAPSNGFLGLFSKNAIIKVYSCGVVKEKSYQNKKANINIKDVSEDIENCNNISTSNDNEILKVAPSTNQADKKNEKIFNNFYANEKENSDENINELVIQNDKIIEEISQKVNELFSKTCYVIDEIKVSYYDEKTVYIEFSGADAALLIGKEGYRYKALSYILFNWIHDKYQLMVRLEIAQFLEQQEKSIAKYLEPVFKTIRDEGSYKTKPFDGILVHITLTKLRNEFPDMYVAVKTNIKGDRYILVNKYNK